MAPQVWLETVTACQPDPQPAWHATPTHAASAVRTCALGRVPAPTASANADQATVAATARYACNEGAQQSVNVHIAVLMYVQKLIACNELPLTSTLPTLHQTSKSG